MFQSHGLYLGKRRNLSGMPDRVIFDYTQLLSFFLLKPSEMAEWASRGQDESTGSNRTVFALWEPSLHVRYSV